MTANFFDIEKLARERAVDPLLMACVEPHDPSLITALDRAMKNHLIKPVLIGDEQSIVEASAEAGVQTRGWELVRSTDPNHSAYTALELIKDNKVGGICKGVFGAQDFLSLLFERRLGFRVHPQLVSGLMVCDVEKLDRLLYIADPIVCPEPELMDMVSIINNSASLAHRLGNQQPKTALLAAVEVIYPQMPATLQGAVIAKMSDKGQIKGCLVDGPLSMDVAVSESAAKEKGAPGLVAGHADILIGPNLATSYGMYKAFAMYTKCEFGLIVLGGKVPAVINSSFDSVGARYNSLLLAVVAAK